jgi:hypothetical protein
VIRSDTADNRSAPFIGGAILQFAAWYIGRPRRIAPRSESPIKDRAAP